LLEIGDVVTGGNGASGHPLVVPIDLVTQTVAVLGRRGAGKTTTAVVIAEEMIRNGQHIIVIDPLDVWWGLRAGFNGEGLKGLSVVVFGGEHADLPLHAHSGALVADAIVEAGMDAVLSLRHMSKSEQRRFVGEFGERLYDRKGESAYRSPLHLFIDEADAFVPQRILPGGERAYGAIDTIVRRGRSSGIGSTLISQRAAVIAKDVLTQTEVLVTHQTTGPQDRKALEEWISANDPDGARDAFMESLASLGRGVAWFWSPSWLSLFKKVAVHQRKTFDSSATPGVNEEPRLPRAMRPIALDKLRKKMEEIETAATDVKGAKEKKNGAGAAEKLVVQERIVRVIEHVVPEAVKRELVSVRAHARTVLAESLGGVRSRLVDLEREVVEIERRMTIAIMAAESKPVTSKQAAKPTPAESPQAGAPKEAPAKNPRRRVLIAIAQNGSRGITKRELRLRCRYTRGTLKNVLGPMRTDGLVADMEADPERLVLTRAGEAELPKEFTPLPVGDALRKKLLGELPTPMSKVLKIVCDAYPAWIARADLAVLAEYTPGTTKNILGPLSTMEVIESRGKDVRASEMLFGGSTSLAAEAS
jgi:hypothetical protein